MSIAVIEGDYTMAGAHALISEQLRTGPVPSAITCSNDLMSIGTLQAAEEARVSVPGDLSLISWDDSLLCSVSRPAITAVDRHPVEYGIRTAQALLHLIRGGTDTTEELTPSQMVLRGTTGPAPGWVRRTTWAVSAGTVLLRPAPAPPPACQPARPVSEPGPVPRCRWQRAAPGGSPAPRRARGRRRGCGSGWTLRAAA